MPDHGTLSQFMFGLKFHLSATFLHQQVWIFNANPMVVFLFEEK
jgi:hypothetical protein